MDPCKVQHVNRSSSDELLRKFADLDSKPEPNSIAKRETRGRSRRQKTSRAECERDNNRESPTRNGSLVELKSLLPPTTRTWPLLWQHRPDLHLREIVVSRSLLKKIEKTWRRTVEGASKMFMGKHSNQHMRLINEVV